MIYGTQSLGMIIFHTFTREFLSTKEALGKYGGNFLETMVCVPSLYYSFHISARVLTLVIL